MSKELTEIEAAICVQMSPALLRWFTGHAPKHGSNRKLPYTEKEGEYFYDEDELIAFDGYLKEPWPKPPNSQRPRVPDGITREIVIEANHKCAFCEYTNSGEVAHIDAVHKSRCNHPHNLVWSCPNHHTEYDFGYKIGTLVKEDHVRVIKEILLGAQLRHWKTELRTISGFLAIIEELRKIAVYLNSEDFTAVRPKLTTLATGLVEAAIKSAKEDANKTPDKNRSASYVRYAQKIAALSAPKASDLAPQFEDTAQIIDDATEAYLEESDLAACPLCRGSGDHNRHRCPVCRGDGTVPKDQVDGIDLRPYRQVECQLCKGSGDHNRHECPVCAGVGTTDSAREVDLKPFEQVDCPVCKGVGDRNGFECTECSGVGTVDTARAEFIDLEPYRQVECPVCKGKGSREGGRECSLCRGNGKIDEGLLESVDVSLYESVECPVCLGKGEFKHGECPFCRGGGEVDFGAAENLEPGVYED